MNTFATHFRAVVVHVVDRQERRFIFTATRALTAVCSVYLGPSSSVQPASLVSLRSPERHLLFRCHCRQGIEPPVGHFDPVGVALLGSISAGIERVALFIPLGQLSLIFAGAWLASPLGPAFRGAELSTAALADYGDGVRL